MKKCEGCLAEMEPKMLGDLMMECCLGRIRSECKVRFRIPENCNGQSKAKLLCLLAGGDELVWGELGEVIQDEGSREKDS